MSKLALAFYIFVYLWYAGNMNLWYNVMCCGQVLVWSCSDYHVTGRQDWQTRPCTAAKVATFAAVHVNNGMQYHKLGLYCYGCRVHVLCVRVCVCVCCVCVCLCGRWDEVACSLILFTSTQIVLICQKGSVTCMLVHGVPLHS